MPRVRLTKSTIDALRMSKSDIVYWDASYPGFGVKVTPKGRKVFIVLYRTEAAQVHHRSIRARDPASSTGGGAEDIRRKA
jgi:hypothetical protein